MPRQQTYLTAIHNNRPIDPFAFHFTVTTLPHITPLHRWYIALTSGAYQQCYTQTNQLQPNGTMAYCGLGLLYHLTDLLDEASCNVHADRVATALDIDPQAVYHPEALGLIFNLVGIALSSLPPRIIRANDIEGLSFPQIALLLRQQPVLQPLFANLSYTCSGL